MALWLFGAIGTAVFLFVGTNLDDIIVLAALNAGTAVNGRPRRWQIWCGQYTGFAILVGASLAVAGGLAVVPVQWIRVLGLVPIGIGIVRLIANVRARFRSRPVSDASPTRLIGVILLTLANGSDNIAAYTPVFKKLPIAETLITLATFVPLVAAWCCLAALLPSHPLTTRIISRWGVWSVPVLYVAIGAWVILKAQDA